jgi:Arc/MetJ-type ribon-helix-helix transcriptional regulator
MENETITVSTRITKPMLTGVQKVLASDAHLNIADYLRDLIRRDLEGKGIKLKEASSQ